MRVLLIRPPQIHWKNEEKRVAQPLGLLYLAGALREAGYEIGFVDAVIEGYNNETEIKKDLFEYGINERTLEDKIKEFSPDVVGIESNFTYFWSQAKKVASLVTKIDEKIITVVGGHHVIGIKQEIKQNNDIDYVIEREGEFKFLDLIDSLNGNSKSRIRKDFRRLDELADPAFDLLKPESYNPRMSSYVKTDKKFFVYLSQRGCSFNCDFCTTPSFFGMKLRHLSIERVKTHLKKIKEMGFEEIVFEDDNLLLMPRDYRKEYHSIPKQLGLTAFQDARFYYPFVKERDVKDLAEAGIYGMFLPVESVNIDTMHKQNKYTNINQGEQYKQLEKVTKWLNNAGIVFYCGTMIGFPGEYKKSLETAVNYAKFLKDLGAIAMTFHWFHPYPGTSVYYKYYKLVPKERRWETAPEYWNFIKPVIPLKDISLEKAEEYIDEKFFEINGITSRSPSYHFKF